MMKTLDVTDWKLQDVIDRAQELNLDFNEVNIEYEACGSHTVILSWPS